MSTVLTVNNLSRAFGGLQAVSDVGFEVSQGMIKAVIGPNGAGKTTLFNLISGSLASDTGTILFQDKPIHQLRPHQIAACGISRTFQNIKMFAGMSAVENVMVGMHTRSQSEFIAGIFNLPWTWKEERRIRQRAMELLDFFDIAQHAEVESTSLAFGQQRAVEFARALAGKPTLLLLDEPAAGLNIYETAEVGRQIVKIRDELGVTVLLVEHDMSLVMKISDEIAVLSYGEKIADDTPAAIQSNPEVIRIYLGEDDA